MERIISFLAILVSCCALLAPPTFAADSAAASGMSCATAQPASDEKGSGLKAFVGTHKWVLRAPFRGYNPPSECGRLLAAASDPIALQEIRPDFSADNPEDSRFAPIKHCATYWEREGLPPGAGKYDGAFHYPSQLGKYELRSYNVSVGSGSDRRKFWIVFGRFDADSNYEFDGYRIVDAPRCVVTGMSPIDRRYESATMRTGTIAHGMFRLDGEVFAFDGNDTSSPTGSGEKFLMLTVTRLDAKRGTFVPFCGWTARPVLSN